MAKPTKPIADRSSAERQRPARVAAIPKSARRSPLLAAGEGEVRFGPVAAIPDVLRKFGVTPSLAFVRAGVPLHAFKNPENRIAFDALGRLLAECSKATACDHFGLIVGECFELDGLGAIGYLANDGVPDACRCCSEIDCIVGGPSRNTYAALHIALSKTQAALAPVLALANIVSLKLQILFMGKRTAAQIAHIELLKKEIMYTKMFGLAVKANPLMIAFTAIAALVVGIKAYAKYNEEAIIVSG